jgi:hypothetical protein
MIMIIIIIIIIINIITFEISLYGTRIDINKIMLILFKRH